MKRILTVVSILLMPSFLFAISPSVWKSSRTATSDGEKMLCGKKAIFHGICTDFGVASSSMTFYNSSWTVTNTLAVGPVSTFVADQCKYYDISLTNGLFYKKTNTAGVTMMYECY